MSGELRDILAWFGTILILLIVVAIFISFWDWAKDHLYYIRKRYQHRHRFEKDPIANCYCVACESWTEASNDGCSGYCYSKKRYTADSYFCKDARLRGKETYIRQKPIDEK